ncbi:unnamed protein product [Penicillium glandicola]
MAKRVPRNVHPIAMTPDGEIASSPNPNRIDFNSNTDINNLLASIDFIDLKLDTGVIDSAVNIDLIDLTSDIRATYGPSINTEATSVAVIPSNATHTTQSILESKTTSEGSVAPGTVNSWSFAFAAGLTARLTALKLETGWEWSSGGSNLPQWFLASPGRPWAVSKETKKIRKGVKVMGWMHDSLYLFLREDFSNGFRGENRDLTAYHEPSGSHRILKMSLLALEDCMVRAMGIWEEHKLLVTGHDKGLLRIWDIRRGRIVCWLKGLEDTISCIELGKHTVIAGSRDGTICVWDLSKSKDDNASLTLKGHTGAVLCLKLNGNYFVSGGHDQEARVWNLETGECKHVLQGHEKEVRFVCMNEHAIVTASADTTHSTKSGIRVWLPNTEAFAAGQCDFKYIGPKRLNHLHMVGDDLIAAGDCGSVVKCNVIGGDKCVFEPCDGDSVVALATTEKFVMTGKRYGKVYLLDREKMHRIRLMDGASEVWKVGVLGCSQVIAAYKKDGYACLTIWHV